MAWPCAIAPPSTLTISSGRPIFFITASGTAANASLISIRSTSDRRHSARLRTSSTAGAGAMPKTPGSTAEIANATSFATGCKLFRSAKVRVETSMPEAPEFRPGALPAVMVPSGLKAGRNFDSSSRITRIVHAERRPGIRPAKFAVDILRFIDGSGTAVGSRRRRFLLGLTGLCIAQLIPRAANSVVCERRLCRCCRLRGAQIGKKKASRFRDALKSSSHSEGRART